MSELVARTEFALPVPRRLDGVRRRSAALLAQPAVRRALPWALAGGLLTLVALGWLLLRAPDWRPLFPQLAESDKAAVVAALEASNFAVRIDPATGAVEVPREAVAAARIMLAGQGMPKSAPTGYDLLGAMPMGTSRAVETARLKQAQESELAASIAAIDGVERASVHLAVGEVSVFVRDRAAPSASVFVTLAAGRTLGAPQVRAIVHLVAASVAGLAASGVSVVDQSGTLLSGEPGAGPLGESTRQLAYQAQYEALVRQRLAALLTPMLGAGNYSAEVAAELDFSENAATRESYDAPGVVRTETGSSSSEPPLPAARGIPGALSNSVPPAAGVSDTPPPVTAAPAPVNGPKSESFNRSYEIGKAVSVTRAAPGALRRLSVAVVVRDEALGSPKTRAAQLAAIERLVRGAAGFDARRGDTVTVAARPFAAAEIAPGQWWDAPVVREGGQGVALLMGLALLIFGLARPLLTRLLPPLAEPTDAEPMALPAGHQTPIDYAAKLGETRRLIAADAGRGAVVIRQLLRADAA